MSKDARELFAQMLIKKYGGAINKITMQILQDSFIVDDIIQEVVLKCAYKQEMLEQMHERKVMAYICTTAKNVCLNELRKRDLENKKLDQWYNDKILVLRMDKINFEAFDDKYGFSAETQELLNALTPVDKDIMVYKYYYELSNQEIADILGTSIGSVRLRFQRAKAKLVGMLAERGENHENE